MRFRVLRLAGEDGNLTKENFVKILKSSDLFLKSFDKNKDGVVTEVRFTSKLKLFGKHDNPRRT